jgi:hypothetical protein
MTVCAAVDCVSGYVCVPHEVQCIRAPCPPIAECVPASSAPSRADGREEADSDDEDWCLMEWMIEMDIM